MRLFLLIILVMAMSSQCSSEKRTIEGSLSLFGNEPFVQLALVTDERERIFLDAEQNLLDSLWANNRGRIKIEGEVYEGEYYGRPHDFIKIEDWEWIAD